MLTALKPRLTVPAGLLLAVLSACGPPADTPAGGELGLAMRQALAEGRQEYRHETWDRLLAASVQDGLVDYTQMQRRRPDLDAYLDGIAGADLSSLKPDELKALLINAYNALTVRLILDHPEVTSIRDIEGAWDTLTHTVGGFPVTLDDLEHQLLRPYFRDPRIHFAVNCASRSCAPLPPRALTGGALDGQLDSLSRRFLRDPQHLRVEDGVLKVSRYFDWYATDFTAAHARPRADTVTAFMALYATPALAAHLRSPQGAALPLQFLDYDWSLNAIRPPDPAAQIPATATGHGGVVTRMRTWIVARGPAGFVLYGLAYVVLTVLFVPAWPLTVGAGAAYGVVAGTALVSISSVTGAALAFLLARSLLRRQVERWVAGNLRFAAIDQAVGRQGWRIVALTRLSPVFPFNLLNYAYGLTAIGFGPYVLASWLAMLPGTLLYVYLGAAGADVAEAATGQVNWLATGLRWVGFAATVIVTGILTRIARRALARATDQAGA